MFIQSAVPSEELSNGRGIGPSDAAEHFLSPQGAMSHSALQLQAPVNSPATPTMLGGAAHNHRAAPSPRAIHFDFSGGPISFEQVERALILEALRFARGNVSQAAKMIGLNRGAIRYRMERLGLERQPAQWDASEGAANGQEVSISRD